MKIKKIIHFQCFLALLVVLSCISKHTQVHSFSSDPGYLNVPDVLPEGMTHLMEKSLASEAYIKSGLYQLPETLGDLNKFRQEIRREIIKNAVIRTFPDLPLNMKETGTLMMKGYSIKNIYFQTLPGIYATANLYIPEGPGPFPAVVHMIGHFGTGKIQRGDPQGVGHSLAINGYVCLSIDPWGYGERTTIHGDFENHGSNLGASVMNIGETLMGLQVTDNIRAVDLLCSLPYVDSKNIGATGASGGGHQTMYLAALDERIKAAVPVVSVGTYKSLYPRGCICNMLLNGLTFTEEAGVLALIAPRALKIINHNQDSSPAFFPSEMIRTYYALKPVYEMLGAGDNVTYQLFDLTHGYKKEDREAMIGWLDLHLKNTGNGSPKMEIPFEFLPPEKLMVFSKGMRDPTVVTTEEYCKKTGSGQRNTFLNTRSFDPGRKKKELKNMLGIHNRNNILTVHTFLPVNGWERLALESKDSVMIPVLIKASQTEPVNFVIICDPEGKRQINSGLISEYQRKGKSIVLVDLSGTGEHIGPATDYKAVQQTMARSMLWLGQTTLGRWVNELDMVVEYLHSRYKVKKICIDGNREAGLAALFLSAIYNQINTLILKNTPLSYIFDDRKTVDFYSMGIHVPGFLIWGDVSLAAALSGTDIVFINPLTMSGNKIVAGELKKFEKEFADLRKICGQKGNTKFDLINNL